MAAKQLGGQLLPLELIDRCVGERNPPPLPLPLLRPSGGCRRVPLCCDLSGGSWVSVGRRAAGGGRRHWGRVFDSALACSRNLLVILGPAHGSSRRCTPRPSCHPVLLPLFPRLGGGSREGWTHMHSIPGRIPQLHCLIAPVLVEFHHQS